MSAEFHPRLIGLTGSKAACAAAARAFRVYFHKTDETSDYLVDHSIIMYLIGARASRHAAPALPAAHSRRVRRPGGRVPGVLWQERGGAGAGCPNRGTHEALDAAMTTCACSSTQREQLSTHIVTSYRLLASTPKAAHDTTLL